MAKKKASPATLDDLHEELISIKRLLAVILLKSGTSQAEIAKALPMDPADLSRMLPARAFKQFSRE